MDNERAVKFIDDNWHKLPKQFNKASMARLMDAYVNELNSEEERVLVDELVKNDLPINTACILNRYINKGVFISYGSRSMPVAIGYHEDSETYLPDYILKIFKNIPKHIYDLCVK